MALPNFQLYYWAANIRPILHWLYEDAGADAPSWCNLEARSCAPSSLSALVHASMASDTAPYTNNILVKTTLRIWKQVWRHYGWHRLSVKSPIHANHMFAPSLWDSAFLHWQSKGIKTLHDLLKTEFLLLSSNCVLNFSFHMHTFSVTCRCEILSVNNTLTSQNSPQILILISY